MKEENTESFEEDIFFFLIYLSFQLFCLIIQASDYLDMGFVVSGMHIPVYYIDIISWFILINCLLTPVHFASAISYYQAKNRWLGSGTKLRNKIS